MPTAPKDKLIKAKVTRRMKREIERLAAQRGESEALIVREALQRYLNYAKRSGLAAIAAMSLLLVPIANDCNCDPGCKCFHCQCRLSLISRPALAVALR